MYVYIYICTMCVYIYIYIQTYICVCVLSPLVNSLSQCIIRRRWPTIAFSVNCSHCSHPSLFGAFYFEGTCFHCNYHPQSQGPAHVGSLGCIYHTTSIVDRLHWPSCDIRHASSYLWGTLLQSQSFGFLAS